MKTLLALTILVSSLAHAENWRDPNAPFDASANKTSSSTIEWIAVDNVQTTCKSEYEKRGYGKLTWNVDACSFWTFSKKICTIYTKKNPTLHDIGHEMRHCFQGNYH